ncbi:unnamed protein product [Lathyrus sativus]|nr:unnamed protein product [Lathyrus sativus]
MLASMYSASQMTWHNTNKTSPDIMRHPSDGETWKHFDHIHTDFAVKPRNVRLGLCSDGPSSPKAGIDVYLQPLIDDLKRSWIRKWTYDISSKQNFTMRAALIWTINDFLAYGMLSGWDTHDKMGCSHCMGNTKAFTLEKGEKSLSFDYHHIFLSRNYPYRRNKIDFKKDKRVTEFAFASIVTG